MSTKLIPGLQVNAPNGIIGTLISVKDGKAKVSYLEGSSRKSQTFNVAEVTGIGKMSAKDVVFKATQKVRAAYLQRIEDEAYEDCERIVERIDWTVKDWCKHLRLTPVYNKLSQCEFPKSFAGSPAEAKYKSRLSESNYVYEKGLDWYINYRLQNATVKYNEAVSKVAEEASNKKFTVNVIAGKVFSLLN